MAGIALVPLQEPSLLAADAVVGFTSDLQPVLDRHGQKPIAG